LITETSSGLPSAIDELIDNWANNELPPVDQWHPTNERTIDMRIQKNGEWWYLGTPIRRPRLVQLFASVLRVDDDGSTYQLKQPALVFTTNVGERVTANAEHLIDVQYPNSDSAPMPYLQVRNGLIARISRAVFIELAERAEIRGEVAGVVSCGVFMPLGPAQ